MNEAELYSIGVLWVSDDKLIDKIRGASNMRRLVGPHVIHKFVKGGLPCCQVPILHAMDYVWQFAIERFCLLSIRCRDQNKSNRYLHKRNCRFTVAIVQGKRLFIAKKALVE